MRTISLYRSLVQYVVDYIYIHVPLLVPRVIIIGPRGTSTLGMTTPITAFTALIDVAEDEQVSYSIAFDEASVSNKCTPLRYPHMVLLQACCYEGRANVTMMTKIYFLPN